MDLDDSIAICQTSLANTLIPVNAYQRDQFTKYGIRERDPMFQTMATMLEIRKLCTWEAIKKKADSFREMWEMESGNASSNPLPPTKQPSSI